MLFEYVGSVEVLLNDHVISEIHGVSLLNVADFYFQEGDVLSITENGESVVVLNSIRFACGSILLDATEIVENDQLPSIDDSSGTFSYRVDYI